MTAKRKDSKGRGGPRAGAGGPKAPMRVDASSPLMRGLGKALAESGNPSSNRVAEMTGIPRATIAHAMLHGRTPAAVRSIERILDALGYTVVVVPKGETRPAIRALLTAAREFVADAARQNPVPSQRAQALLAVIDRLPAATLDP